MQHPALKINQKIKVIGLIDKGRDKEYNGIVSCIDYLPINSASKSGPYVNHVYIKLENEDYKDILERGWSIYCSLPNISKLKKCYISSIDSSEILKVIDCDDILGTRQITIKHNDINSILIWHHAYKIVPL